MPSDDARYPWEHDDQPHDWDHYATTGDKEQALKQLQQQLLGVTPKTEEPQAAPASKPASSPATPEPQPETESIPPVRQEEPPAPAKDEPDTETLQDQLSDVSTGEAVAGEPAATQSAAKPLITRRTARIVGIGVIGLLLATGGTIAVSSWITTTRHHTAVSSCTSEQHDYSSARSTLDKAISQAKNIAGENPDNLNDPKTLEALQHTLTEQPKHLTWSCAASLDTDSLNHHANDYRDASSHATTQADTLRQQTKQVTDSKESHQMDTAINNLNAHIADAQTLHDTSAGQVADEQTRTDLQTAIDTARKTVEQRDLKQPSDYQAAQQALDAPMAAVNASIQAKSAADAAQAAPAPAAPAPAPSATKPKTSTPRQSTPKRQGGSSGNGSSQGGGSAPSWSVPPQTNDDGSLPDNL
ncbi:hypothetical protein [Bifidobacterium mongoliense]|uniref:hypothetical protein n=1 Tax=Bifidobacterium mongoliense TaxID=518643 RepID=UPI0030EEDAF3